MSAAIDLHATTMQFSGTASPYVRVLFVGHDALAAQRVRQYLTSAGTQFDVEQAVGVEEAVDTMDERAFDIVLFDLATDVANIDDLIRLQAQNEHTPVVALVSGDNNALGLRALLAGAKGHLSRGQLDTRALVRSIRWAISGRTQTAPPAPRSISLVASNDDRELCGANDVALHAANDSSTYLIPLRT